MGNTCISKTSQLSQIKFQSKSTNIDEEEMNGHFIAKSAF